MVGFNHIRWSGWIGIRINEGGVTCIDNDGHVWFEEYIVSDVIIAGAGPSGLVAARELSSSGLKTLLIESNNYLGGGFWMGGYLMNTLTFRSPSEKILDELKISYRTCNADLVIADGPAACARLIVAATDAGAKILTMTKIDDVVVRNNRVEGVVINWTAVSSLPRAISCVDPIALESKVVIDATGHEAWVCKSLEKRNLLKLEECGPMDVVGSEDMVVEKTGQVYPGLFVTGMATATVFGIPRMGPTFGGMLYAGKKVACDVKAALTNTE